MKNNIKMFALTVVVLAICGCNRDSRQILKIGADLTLSGNIAYWGVQIQKGLMLAADEFNATSVVSKIEIVSQDNKGTAANAVSVFRRLAAVDHASAVVSVFSPVSNPLREVANQMKIPLLATVVSAEGFGVASPWCFRDFPSQSQQSVALAQYVMNTVRHKRYASLVVNDDYGKDGEVAFCDEIIKLGGQVLVKEYMSQNDLVVVNQINKILAATPECVYIVVRDTALGAAVRQFREHGFQGLIVGVNAFDSPLVWEAAGVAGEGCVFSSAYVDLDDKKALGFNERFQKKFGEFPDWIAAYGYSIGEYLVGCVAESNGNAESVREKLSQVRVNSIRGVLTMDSNRDVISPIGIFVREKDVNKLLLIK